MRVLSKALTEEQEPKSINEEFKVQPVDDQEQIQVPIIPVERPNSKRQEIYVLEDEDETEQSQANSEVV